MSSCSTASGSSAEGCGEWLEGKLLSGFLATGFAPKWTADGIRVFGWGTLVAGTLCFLVGVTWVLQAS